MTGALVKNGGALKPASTTLIENDCRDTPPRPSDARNTTSKVPALAGVQASSAAAQAHSGRCHQQGIGHEHRHCHRRHWPNSAMVARRFARVAGTEVKCGAWLAGISQRGSKSIDSPAGLENASSRTVVWTRSGQRLSIGHQDNVGLTVGRRPVIVQQCHARMQVDANCHHDRPFQLAARIADRHIHEQALPGPVKGRAGKLGLEQIRGPRQNRPRDRFRCRPPSIRSPEPSGHRLRSPIR